MNTLSRIAVGLLVVGIASWGVAQAEPGPPPPGPGPRPACSEPPPGMGPGAGPHKGMLMKGVEGACMPDLEDRDTRELIEAVMMAKLADELGLNDEQTVLMFRRFRDQKQQMADLGNKRQEALKALKETIKAGAADSEIAAALTKLIETDKAISQVRLDAFEKTADSFTITQRAKLYVFASDFERQMRDLIGKARERRARMMWGVPEDREKGPAGPGSGEARPWRGEQGGPRGPAGEGRRLPQEPVAPPQPPVPPAEGDFAPRVP